MNSREKTLASMVIICLIIMGSLIVGYNNLPNSYTQGIETTSEFFSTLEINGSDIPKIFVGEEYLFGEPFNFSIWSNPSKEIDYMEKYIGHLQEVITIMKFQVYLLGEDPELFEQCVFSIYDFQECINYSLPYVAWKGRYGDCPIAIDYFEDPSKYDDVDVWAIKILFNYKLGMETTYYIDTETLKRLPFTLETN